MATPRQRGGSAVLFGLPGQEGSSVDAKNGEQMRKLQMHLNPTVQVIGELSPRPPKGSRRGTERSPGVLRRTNSSSSQASSRLSFVPMVVTESAAEAEEDEQGEDEQGEDEAPDQGGDNQLLAFLAQTTTQQRRRTSRKRRRHVEGARQTLPLLSRSTKAANLKLVVKRAAAADAGVDMNKLDAAVAEAAAEAAPERTKTRSIEFSNGATYTGPGAIRLGIWYPHGRGELALPVFTGLGLNSGVYARGVVYSGTYEWGQRSRRGTLRYPAADARTRAKFQALWKELENATISALRNRVLDMGGSMDELRAVTDDADDADPRQRMISLALNFVSDVYTGGVEPAGTDTDVQTNAHQSQIFEVVDSGQPSPPPPPKLQRHGEGEMWWGGVGEAAWRAHYVGTFVQDRRHGTGVMRWRAKDLSLGDEAASQSAPLPTEYRYEGEWRDGKPCGKGTMTKRRQVQTKTVEQATDLDKKDNGQHETTKIWEESVAVGEWHEGVPLKGTIEEKLYLPNLAEHKDRPQLSPSFYEGSWGNTKHWRGALARFKSAGRKAMALSELTPLQHAKRAAGKRVWRLFTPEEKSMALARSIEIIELAENEGADQVFWDDQTANPGCLAEADDWWPRRNGKGVRKLPEGGSYVGVWEADLPHGEGKLTLPDGTVMFGELWSAARPGAAQGQAVVKYASGGRYEGQWDNRYGRHGDGVMRYASQTTDVITGVGAAACLAVYEGKWVQNEPGEHGRLKYTDGAEYIGAIKDGRPCGEGAMTYPPGTRSHSLLQAGGHGSSTSDLCDANLHSSLPSGVEPQLEPAPAPERLTALQANAGGPIIVRFKGQWLGGWRVYGVCEYNPTTADQQQEDAACGEEVRRARADTIPCDIRADWAGWLRYSGHIVDSKEHGHGVVDYVDGRWFEGEIENGIRSDYVCLINDGCNADRDNTSESHKKAEGRMTYPDGHVYIGHFANGMRHGTGTMWYPNKHGVLSAERANHPVKSGDENSLTDAAASARANRSSVSSVLYQAALVLEGIAAALDARLMQPWEDCAENQSGSKVLGKQMDVAVGVQKLTTSFMQDTQAPPCSPAAADDEQLPNHLFSEVDGADWSSANVLDIDTETDCCFQGEWLNDQRVSGRLASNFPETDYDIAPPSVSASTKEQRFCKLHKGGQLLTKHATRRSRTFAWQRKGPCRYVGGWRDERPHGKGVMRWWSKGNPANGTMAAGGEVYTGEWHAGARHGVGISVQGQAAVYNGKWVKDRYDGVGDLLEIYACSRYKGEFWKGQKHGAGVERQDGVGGEYRGTWERGMMHGPGVYRYSDGSEWARRYAHGKLLTDELIGSPNMIDDLNVKDMGADDLVQFHTPPTDCGQALEYSNRIAKLRSRHRAVLLSVDAQVAKDLKQQQRGFSRVQRTKIIMSVHLRLALMTTRRRATELEAAKEKEAASVRLKLLQTMPSATLEDQEDPQEAA